MGIDDPGNSYQTPSHCRLEDSPEGATAKAPEQISGEGVSENDVGLSGIRMAYLCKRFRSTLIPVTFCPFAFQNNTPYSAMSRIRN